MRRNNDKTKLLIIFITLLLILTAHIGCLNDLIHVTLCFFSSNLQCTQHYDINRMIGDIAYWITYISLYFVIVSDYM